MLSRECFNVVEEAEFLKSNQNISCQKGRKYLPLISDNTHRLRDYHS